MITYKKCYLMIVFILSFSIQTIGQTCNYYYKGVKIPLYVNNNKACISIIKENKKVNERILANVKVLNKINDKKYNICVVPQSDIKMLNSLHFLKEDLKSIVLTSCYLTEKNKEVFSTPYLNVKLKNEQDKDLLALYAEKYKLRIVGNGPYSPRLPLWYVLEITSETQSSPLDCANELYETGVFAESIPDFCSDNLICSNDPKYYLQWGLQNNNYQNIDISASPAWNYATGKNVKIAILDTGVDLKNIDLSGNIYNLGYDTETQTSPSRLYEDHATHCAGIAAAIKDNGKLIAGVAPEASIISISHRADINDSAPLKWADGIIWAYQNGADIISNSWYYPTHHAAIDDAIQDAFRFGRNGKGCVIVFATGNNGNDSISYPSNCNDTILAVGAIDQAGERWQYSNYGEKLDLVAPGVGIYSTLPEDVALPWSGTSMACPHVSGVAALVLERNSELTVTQVNSIINSNAKKLSGVSFNVIKPDGFWNNEFGYGLVDAYSSVINTPRTAYIQNEIVTGTRIISAGSIYIGKDVTDTKPQGDVILGQGDITIKAGCIEIKNSTIVPLGTTLTIEN